MAKWDDNEDDFLTPGRLVIARIPLSTSLYFSLPSSGSGLASIFGVSSAMDSAGNPSLTYQAPKQPKKSKGECRQGGCELYCTPLLQEEGRPLKSWPP